MTDEGRVEIMAFEPESASLSRIHTLHAHTGIAYAMAFARDDSCFVTGASDGIVAVFDANDLICKQTIDRMEYGVRSVSVSVDSRYLAIGSEDLAIDIVRFHITFQKQPCSIAGPMRTHRLSPNRCGNDCCALVSIAAGAIVRRIPRASGGQQGAYKLCQVASNQVRLSRLCSTCGVW